jgi:hypothetical protein
MIHAFDTNDRPHENSDSHQSRCAIVAFVVRTTEAAIDPLNRTGGAHSNSIGAKFNHFFLSTQPGWPQSKRQMREGRRLEKAAALEDDARGVSLA